MSAIARRRRMAASLPSPPRRPFGGTFALSENQELLLRAALTRGRGAVRAYDTWRRTVELRAIDVSSQRLLPLVVRMLESEGGFEDDLLLAQCRKVARFTWLKSQMLVAETAPAIAALRVAGYPVMIVKGAAVVDRTGGDVAGRPMDDVDVVVPPDCAVEAFDVLADLGFLSRWGHMAERDARALVARRHAFEVMTAKGAAIDLHWHVLATCLRTADARFWGHADVTTVGGEPCQVTSREDAMVHAVAHAFTSRPTSGLRWASDVVALARIGDVRWDALVDSARACRMGVPMADTLAVLRRVVGLDVPSPVLRQLRRAPVTQHLRAWPRLDHREQPRRPIILEYLADAYEEYLGQSEDPEPRLRAGGVARFLAHHWALPSEHESLRHSAFVAVGRPWRLRSRWQSPAQTRARAAESLHDAAGRPPYRLGTETAFTLGAEGSLYLARGWSNPEEHGTWSTSAEATLFLPLEPVMADELAFRITMLPFLVPLRRHLRVDFVVNGVWSAQWDFEGSGIESRQVEARALVGPLPRGGTLELRFVIDRPLSPESAWLEAGTRQLGLSLHSLQIDGVRSSPPGGADREGAPTWR